MHVVANHEQVQLDFERDFGRDADPELKKVVVSPSGYNLVLEGHHDRPECNGTYMYDGVENDKPKWAKDGSMKVFWTGRSWDVYWGGFSPEAEQNTPIPPPTGYDGDKGNCDIKVSYIQDPELLKVAESPSAYYIILKGAHDRPEHNGTYVYDGEENGKPKWAKDGKARIFWNRRSWDVAWGGYSPEAE